MDKPKIILADWKTQFTHYSMYFFQIVAALTAFWAAEADTIKTWTWLPSWVLPALVSFFAILGAISKVINQPAFQALLRAITGVRPKEPPSAG